MGFFMDKASGDYSGSRSEDLCGEVFNKQWWWTTVLITKMQEMSIQTHLSMFNDIQPQMLSLNSNQML
jgi:hypothetical protein